jgi:hypothetical protein
MARTEILARAYDEQMRISQEILKQLADMNEPDIGCVTFAY